MRKYIHSKYKALQNCRLTRGDDIAILIIRGLIDYNSKTQPIAIQYSRITDNLLVVKMGYEYNANGDYGRLSYGLGRARNCPNAGGSMICIPRRNSVYSRDSGGPLVACRKGTTQCKQIGVAVGGFTTTNDEYFVSTHTQIAFLRDATAINSQKHIYCSCMLITSFAFITYMYMCIELA